ncbi:MAG: outer membrane lipoprotein-sorting protein [Candidatus Aminicenantes bacterium]|nr:outer membrane lipoprotein-sorting protein [Candidatus Aminicenantes bacterium]
MKRALSISMAFALILIISAAPLFCIPTQENKTDAKAAQVLSKMIDAQGGKTRIQGINDMTVTGIIELTQMGMEGSLTLYHKEPDKMRMDMEMMGMVITQAFDGKTAWMFNPQTGENEEVPEQMAADLKRQALGNDSLLHPEKYGITYTYEGTEMVEGKQHHVLTQHFEDEFEATLYIDSETYLTTKSNAVTIDQNGVEVNVETFQSDYKEVDGTMVAHSIISYRDGEEFMITTLSDVTYNSGLKDSLFKMD